MNRTCCPQYPIRCDVASLRLTKSQKKVIKRVNRYLSYGERQTVTSSEPERHGREDVPAAAAAAADDDDDDDDDSCHVMMDDVKSQAALLPSPESACATDAHAAGPLLSTGTVSSSSSEKKTTHRTPKPGAHFVTMLLVCL